MVNATHSLAQQSKTVQISGHVVDVVGATIKGASVFVRRHIPSEENVNLLVHTDVHGDFKLLLPEGGYDVLVTSPGFAARVRTVSVRLKGKRGSVEAETSGPQFPRHELRYLSMFRNAIEAFTQAEGCPMNESNRHKLIAVQVNGYARNHPYHPTTC